FKAALAARDPEPAPAVTLDVCRSEAFEAATVVGRIRAALAGDPQSIAILERKRSDLAELLPALRGAGIAYAAVDLDRFSARLARFSAAVAPALRERGRVPLATMVRGAWLALAGPACVAESIDLDAAQRVLSRLAEHSSGADVADWPAFVAALDALYADHGI